MVEKRKKPLFFRPGWYRIGRVGKKVKKKRVWRHAKGGDSKIRLKERGYAARPTIGWGSDKEIRDKINGFSFTRVENLSQLEKVKKGDAILIASVGRKKKEEIKKKAEEMKLKILNKYYKKNDSKE
jgi:large subunit ribosomal protein L32e